MTPVLGFLIKRKDAETQSFIFFLENLCAFASLRLIQKRYEEITKL